MAGQLQGQKAASNLVEDGTEDKSTKYVEHQAVLGNFLYPRLARNRDKFHDVILKVKGENKAIYAHKIILASFSDYFTAMFNPDSAMIEKDLKEITLALPNFSSCILRQIIDYAYTGAVTITWDNVQDLAVAAGFFDVRLLTEECSEFMKANILSDNCLGMLAFAEINNLEGLYSTTLQFARRKFEDIYLSNEVCLLSPETLIKFISEDLLITRVSSNMGETLVMDMVVAYLHKREQLSTDQVASIMHQIKLPYLDDSTLRSLMKLKVLQEIQGFDRLLEEALKFKKVEKANPPVKHWIQRRMFSELQYIDSDAFGTHLTTLGQPVISFDDKSWIAGGRQLSGMKMWFRFWEGTDVLGGLELFYDGISTGVHGSDHGDSYEFTLLPGEFITSAVVYSGWLIDSLQFKSNKNNIYGPYGGSGGGIRNVNLAAKLGLKQDQVRLAYFKGSMINTTSTRGYFALMKFTLCWAYESSGKIGPLSSLNVNVLPSSAPLQGGPPPLLGMTAFENNAFLEGW